MLLDPRKLMQISRWVLSASVSHSRGYGLLIHWVVPEVLLNIIRLVSDESMLGLGLASSILRPKMRLRGIIALK